MADDPQTPDSNASPSTPSATSTEPPTAPRPSADPPWYGLVLDGRPQVPYWALDSDGNLYNTDA